LSGRIYIKKSGTMGMGTGSDTRMYAPRSESSHMYRANNEDESTYTGAEDPRYRDQIADKKKKERKKRANEMKRLKHLSIKPSDLESIDNEDEEEKFNSRAGVKEPSIQTGSSGNFGALTSLAMQARGPGFAGGEGVEGYKFSSEPMKVAFRLLKAYEDKHLQSYLDGDIDELGMFGHSFDQDRFPFLHVNANHPFIHDNDDVVNELMTSEGGYESMEPYLRNYENELKAFHDHMVLSGSPQGSPPQLANGIRALVNDYREQSGVHDMTEEEVMRASMAMYMATLKALKLKNAQPSFDPSMLEDLKSEPMSDAWSELLKSKKSKKKDKKTKKEERKKWRPSTGMFKKPPGGFDISTATPRRAKARMRGIKGGKRTGLGRAHLAVEMGHRTVGKNKQPTSKDIGRYRQYLGQQEAQRRLGNIRSPTSIPQRFGARSYRAGPTGGGALRQLAGQAALARRPAIRRPSRPRMMPSRGVRRPTMPRAPSMPVTPSPQYRSGYARQSMVGGAQYAPSRMPSASMQGGPSMVMTGEIGEGSDLQKKRFTYYDKAELRQLINEARMALKRKDKKNKGKGDANVGVASNLPNHNNAPTKETTRPEGATEDANNDPRTFGVNPLDHLTSRGGRTP